MYYSAKITYTTHKRIREDEFKRAFMADAASQAGDADSSRAPGLTYGLQGSTNVHRGALLFVPQWQCISSFVVYIHRWKEGVLNKIYEENSYTKQKFKNQKTPQKRHQTFQFHSYCGPTSDGQLE